MYFNAYQYKSRYKADTPRPDSLTAAEPLLQDYACLTKLLGQRQLPRCAAYPVLGQRFQENQRKYSYRNTALARPQRRCCHTEQVLSASSSPTTNTPIRNTSATNARLPCHINLMGVSYCIPAFFCSCGNESPPSSTRSSSPLVPPCPCPWPTLRAGRSSPSLPGGRGLGNVY